MNTQIITINEKTFVRVSKHINGYYTQLVYNGGTHGGAIHIYKSEKAAIKKANKIKSEY